MPPANLKDAFFRVTDRALDAGDSLADVNIQEKAGFLAYHSFESCGGAFCNARGITFHPASHPTKIDRFVSGMRKEKYSKEGAALAVQVKSLRNSFLYPRSVHGVIHMPEDVISVAQVRRLLGRVRTFVGKVRASV